MQSLPPGPWGHCSPLQPTCSDAECELTYLQLLPDSCLLHRFMPPSVFYNILRRPHVAEAATDHTQYVQQAY